MITDLQEWLEHYNYNGNTVDMKGEHGNTALMRAAIEGNLIISKALLELGADVKLTNDDGNQALWLACFSENAELISLLITAGCDVDNANVNGVTPLMYTASSGKERMVDILMDAGADVSIQSPDDFSALDLAATPKIYKRLRKANT